MSAQGACQYGGTEVHPRSLRWEERKNERSEPVQPTIPFGRTLMKPSSKPTENDDSELQATVGKSVERLIEQQKKSQQQGEKTQKENDRGQKTTVILLKDYPAKMFDKRCARFSSEIQLEKGNLLRSLAMKYDADLLRRLKEAYEGDAPIEEPMYMQCIDVLIEWVCVRVSYKSIAILNAYPANILKAITDLNKRLDFFADVGRFQFVGNLQFGDKVSVQRFFQKEKTSRFCDGHVAWIGEMKPDRGVFFGITVKRVGEDFSNAPGTLEKSSKAVKTELLYVTGDMLHRPNTTKASGTQASSFFGPAPEICKTENVEHSFTVVSSDEECGKTPYVRQVPIRLVQNDYRDSELSKRSLRHPVNIVHKEIENGSQDYFSNFGTSSRAMANGFYDGFASKPSVSSHDGFLSKPSVSSEYLMPDSTPILEQEHNSTSVSGTKVKIKENDGILWTDVSSVPHSGVVRWIGRLRGHSHLYAGVEFDDPIGRGTGRYEGCDLFRARRDHAGFLPLSALKRITHGDEKSDQSVDTKALVKATRPSASSVNPYAPEQKLPHGVEPPCIQSESYALSEVPLPVTTLPLVPCHASSLAKGSCVLVDYRNCQRFGVVRWIGVVFDDNTVKEVDSAAVEIDGSLPENWPNALERLCNVNGQLLFCSTGEVALVPVSALFEDRRFPDSTDHADTSKQPPSVKMDEKNFGTFDSGIEEVPYLPTNSTVDLVGTMKGIQGCRNSCYLDATLYAMFVQNTAFDHLLRVKKDSSNPLRARFISTLATEIVYPLRRSHFVRADHVKKLRELLQSLLPEMPGLTSEEKDPEELLTALFGSVFRTEPFLTMRKLNDGKMDTAYICPLITDDVWSNQQKHLISVQSLLERSLYASNIQFAKEPRILILQLPRYGKEKVFCKVVPQQELDVTHLIYNVRRPCATCSKQAELICPECFLTREILFGEVTYCRGCYKRAHIDEHIFDHQSQTIRSEGHSPFDTLTRKPQITKRKLQLSAVLSIETSHYVAFVRSLSTNKWFLYDSMADRVGLENGYNVPKVKSCERVPQWLSESGLAKLRNCFEKGHLLPSEVENDPDLMRLFSDCYICFYTSPGDDGKAEATGNVLSRLLS